MGNPGKILSKWFFKERKMFFEAPVHSVKTQLISENVFMTARVLDRHTWQKKERQK